MSRIRIGTRGSTLALAQANWIKGRIEQARGDIVVELAIIKTGGDRFIDTPLAQLGGKGIFTKEIEEALLRREIDLAVHSMKDLPTELPAGLAIAAVPEREDPRDCLVSASGLRLDQLAAGSKIGTGSLRRRAQLLHHRKGLELAPIRGNVDTRLKKLAGGEVDALVMAAAGLKRIGCADRITEFLPDRVCLSAAAQGALGIEARAGDAVCREIAFLHDASTFACVCSERSLLRRLGGGCQVPVGARARVSGGDLRLLGAVAAPDGSLVVRGEISGPAERCEKLGQELAETLLGRGADRILAAVS